MEDKPESRKWMKFPSRFRKNIRPQEQKTGQAARGLGEPEHASQKSTTENLSFDAESEDSDRKLSETEDNLEETSRKLSVQEEALLSQAQPSEEDVDQLQRDLEVLKLRVLMVVQHSLTSDDLGSGLTSAVAAMQLQERRDRRWAGGSGPRWRPLKCLGSHNTLLADVVESRLEEAARDGDQDGDQDGAGGLSTPIKRQVCRVGKRVKADLLRCVRVLRPCYGDDVDDVDVLNIYAGLCQRWFSARLGRIIQGGLEAHDSAYLLFWVNTFYPQEVLQHEELRGKLKTGCLGGLLQQDQVRQLEEQHVNNKEVSTKKPVSKTRQLAWSQRLFPDQAQVSLWLHKVLQREEENWTGTNMPEVLDDYFFCPLAVDVIQVTDGFLADLSCLIGDDDTKSHRVQTHLESFLLRYKKSLEKLSQRKDEHASTWMKAHLACEEQLRDYIRGQPGGQTESQLESQSASRLGSQTGSQARPQKGSCEAILDALREFVYSTFTRPIHGHLKVYRRQLWTLGWLDGSLPVMDLLLDSLSELFELRLRHLKASCRHSLVRTFQRELVSAYVRRMSKSRLKSGGEEQAAERVAEDAGKMDDFFHAATGGGERSRFGPMLRHVADMIRPRRAGSIREEMLAFARKFPDFSDPVLSALLALKSEISAADVRSVRRGVSEERTSTNQRSALFSGLKGGKWVRTTATPTDAT
ncbi:tumor necrosis factor alpha-induced protein 2-like isoform X3 [Vanacampus margaritifer]